MNNSKKYGRTLHAQISLGTTSDDRFMPNGYIESFSSLEKLIMTEKLDGQNNCLNQYGVFARSHASPSIHPWDKPLKRRWELIKNSLGSLEIFGENMYGTHSIGYNKLESFFYVFAIRDKDKWLSWEEVEFYANLLEFPVAPRIEIKHELKDVYNPKVNENDVLRNWLSLNLSMSFEDFVLTSGHLGGFDPVTSKNCCEGLVIRNSDEFNVADKLVNVANNELSNVFKLVREKHVKTDIHWTKNWKPAKLIDYNKYNWQGYNY